MRIMERACVFRQECADVRELMAGLRAIHTFYEENEGMITGN